MNPHAILAPVFALAGWTGCVLVLVAFRRVRAGTEGRVKVSAFRLGEAPDVPPDVSLPNRNYMNLLELPLLFYVVCMLAFATGKANAAHVALAWTYVGTRIVHSLVHLTYNHVMHRFAAFVASNVVLLVLWALVGHAVFGAA